jgi:hypothetical protein
MMILDLPSVGGTDIMVSGGQHFSKHCRKFCSGVGALVSPGFEGWGEIVADAPECPVALKLAAREVRDVPKLM